MSRVLTPGERLYVRKILRTERRLLTLGLVTVSAALVPIVGIVLMALMERRWAILGISLAMGAVCAAAIVYIGRRVKRLPLDGQIVRVSGELRTSEVSVGESSVPVHHLGSHVVTVPEHWLKLIADRHLEGEVYPTPLMGFDAGFYGTDKKGILLSAGQLSVDQEVPLGLLHLPTYPRWAANLFLGLSFVTVLSLAILERDELRWSVRNAVSGSRQYRTIAEFFRSPPPRHTHVDFAAACLINAQTGDARTFYICDLSEQERATLERLAEGELSRLRFARSTGVVADERLRASFANDRKPAQSIANAMQEIFRTHRCLAVRQDSSSTSESALDRLPAPPRFDDLEDGEYRPLTESLLVGLGRAPGWSGFYVGEPTEHERNVPILELGELDGVTRWRGVLLAPLLVLGVGLVGSVLKSIRDPRIRRRIAKAHASGG